MDPASPEWVYKILRPHEWQQFLDAGTFGGSPDDLRDGYIHLSTAEQLPGTLGRHFAADAEVVILRVAAASTADGLKWEPSRNGALFPHLYRPLRLGDVTRSSACRRGPAGFDLGFMNPPS